MSSSRPLQSSSYLFTGMITKSSSCFYSALTHSLSMILSCPFDRYHPCPNSSNPFRSSFSQILMKSFPNEVLFLTISPAHTTVQSLWTYLHSFSSALGFWPRTPSTLRFPSLKFRSTNTLTRCTSKEHFTRKLTTNQTNTNNNLITMLTKTT